jgi:hypothetical protein
VNTAFTLEHKIKWLARFFDLSIKKYIEWEVTTREEDGGAYDRQSHKRKNLELAIDAMWSSRKMDQKIEGVLKYRDLNYKDESDEELGISKRSGQNG